MKRVLVTCAHLLTLLSILLMAMPALPVAHGRPSMFTITWSASCETPPPEAVTALEYAASLWGTWLASPVPIAVDACWTPQISAGDALGSGRPLHYAHNFTGAPLVDVHYPVALANALHGSDLYSGVDMLLEFKSDAAWSFALWPPGKQEAVTGSDFDFVTVALHELAHGLGFIGNMYVSYSIGFCGDGPYGYLYPCPTPYDWHVVDSADLPLLSYQSVNPRELGTRLRSDAHFGGPNSRAAYADMAVPLYAPDTWQIGSSLSHLDRATFATSNNQLMTPSYSDLSRHPGPLTLAILQDMGWPRAGDTAYLTTTGPLVMGVGQPVPLRGDLVWGDYAGQPITYNWQADEQPIITHPGMGASDTITLTWQTPGVKQVTLTASDGLTQTAVTRTLRLFDLALTGLDQGQPFQPYTFAASVTGSGTFPISYTWTATEQEPLFHPDQGDTDSVTFTWNTPGTKMITVTAVVANAPLTITHEIELQSLILDKFIYLPLLQK